MYLAQGDILCFYMYRNVMTLNVGCLSHLTMVIIQKECVFFLLLQYTLLEFILDQEYRRMLMRVFE